MGRVIEAGHYYIAKGPTIWSKVGWEILQRIQKQGDQTMLFIDDLHGLQDLIAIERESELSDFSFRPDHVVYEASLTGEAEQVFQMLMVLSAKRRPRKKVDGSWFLNGAIKLKYPSGKFSCVMLDAGLCLRKKLISFEVVNVVPCHYESEQRNLLIILKKAMPDFSLQVVLFDLNGKYWQLEG